MIKVILNSLILFALMPNMLYCANEEKTISFNYENEDLVNVINYVASKKEANLLLPSRTEERITGKLTWHLDKKVTVDEAWNILTTILDIAGYNIVPKNTYYES
jgi:type II secretory pathway component GspD/PulD (secretin)